MGLDSFDPFDKTGKDGYINYRGSTGGPNPGRPPKMKITKTKIIIFVIVAVLLVIFEAIINSIY